MQNFDIKCERCNYIGKANTYLPNMTSVHNACRCPECGSTNNPYNRVHSFLISRVGTTLKGPVTENMILQACNLGFVND